MPESATLPVPAPQRQRQRGAVLMVALVVPLVMTVAGLAAVGNATLGERMAANALLNNQAFQTAESTVEAAVAEVRTSTSEMSSALNSGQPVTLTAIITRARVKGDAELKFLGEGSAPLGWDLGLFSGYHFEVDATGRNAEGSAPANDTNIRQGLTRAMARP